MRWRNEREDRRLGWQSFVSAREISSRATADKRTLRNKQRVSQRRLARIGFSQPIAIPIGARLGQERAPWSARARLQFDCQKTGARDTDLMRERRRHWAARSCESMTALTARNVSAALSLLIIIFRRELSFARFASCHQVGGRRSAALTGSSAGRSQASARRQ